MLRRLGPVVLSLLLASPAWASAPLALDVQVFDDIDSCDEDGILDVGEIGRVVVVVRNLSEQGFEDARVVIRPDPGLHAAWKQVIVPEIAPFGVAVAEFEVTLEHVEDAQFGLQAEISSPSDEQAYAWARRDFPANLDEVHGQALRDNVELDSTAWLLRQDNGYGPASVWSRGLDEVGNHVWFVVGSEAGAHASLESPVIVPSKEGPFVFSFSHRYQMSATADERNAAGVIELSRDGGMSWQDALQYADFDYDGALSGVDVALDGRPAFVGNSPQLPARHRVELRFGHALAGESVKLRFRYAAAPGERGAGWELDDFEVSGTDNAPFDAYVAHRGKCSPRLHFAGGRPLVSIHLPDDPKGDLQGFAVVEAELDPAEIAAVGAEIPVAPSPDEVEARVLVERIRPFDANAQTSPFGRIDGGQVVASGCSATAPGSVPFAAFVLIGWLALVRRRR